MKTLERFLSFLKPYKVLTFWGVLFVVVSSFAALPLPLLLKLIMDRAFPDKDIKLLIISVVGIIFLLLIDQIANLTYTFIFARVREGAFFDLRKLLYKHIQRMSLSYLGGQRAGGLLSRITSDVDAAQFLLAETFAYILRDFLYILGIAVVLLYLNWQLALLSAAMLPLFYFSFVFFGQKMFYSSQKLQQQQELLMGGIAESIAGNKYIKAAGVEEQRLAKAQEQIKLLEKARREMLVKNALAGSTVFLISALATLLIWGFGGMQVILWGKSVGTIFAVYYCLMNLYSPVSNIFRSNLQIQMSLAAAERIFNILDMPIEAEEDLDKTTLSKTPQEIAFENVSFAYDPERGVKLNDFNLLFKPGQLIGIVGPNGSGKSTLWQLLIRFYEIQAGKILIGENDVRQVTLSSLRNYVSFVPQNEFLFNATIHENILMGREITKDKLTEILNQAALDEFLNKAPGGLSAIVGEMGTKLSGGEKQRIMLARALVSDPMVLFVDEGLSQLDPVAEEAVLKSLKQRVKDGKTVVLISHKLSMLKDVDKLFVINEGKVEAEGNIAALTAQHGFLKRMLELQVV